MNANYALAMPKAIMREKMKNLLAALILSIPLAIAGCSSIKNETLKGDGLTSKVNTSKPDSASSNEIPINNRIYYFQHKLISQWVFESDGKFFSDIRSGNVSRLITTASEVVNSDFANEIKLTPIENAEAVLITFQPPKNFGHCYFSIVQKVDSTYRYTTYEKTHSFGEEKFVGVVGGWSKNGDHSNYGPRLYKTANEFINDVIKL